MLLFSVAGEHRARYTFKADWLESLESNPRQEGGGVIGGQGGDLEVSLPVVLAMDRPWFSSKALWYFTMYNMNCAFR